jgi:Nuclease-related domain
MTIFRDKRRETIRQNWHEVLLMVAIVSGFALWVVLETDELRRTIAAFALGGGVAVLVISWMLGFDARLLRWRWGAAGEEWTAEELDRLGHEWRVFHDIPDDRRNWDHIAVGPTGVYAIDSKNLSEPASVDASGLRAGRLRMDGAAGRASAARLKDAIEQASGRAVWVQSVVVVWGALKGGVFERDRVLYAPGPGLVDALRSRPNRLPEHEIDHVASVLETMSAAARR